MLSNKYNKVQASYHPSQGYDQTCTSKKTAKNSSREIKTITLKQ